MTGDDLIAHCRLRRAQGHRYVILKVTRSRRPKTEHVRLCRRWPAKIVGEKPDGTLIVDLAIETVLGPPPVYEGAHQAATIYDLGALVAS